MNQEALDVRAEQWRRIVCECINRDPKISKRQWCRENSIRYRSRMYWQQKFQREALAVINDHGNSLPVQSGSVNVPAFADMTAHLEALQAEECPPAEQEAVTLAPELMIQAGKYRIYVSSSLHEATLETVSSVNKFTGSILIFLKPERNSPFRPTIIYIAHLNNAPDV